LCKFYLKDNDPGKANLHSLLGVFYIKKGDTDRAVSEFRKQLEANHHPEQGYLNLGMALMKKGETDEAIESYKKSLELFPRNPRTHYQLGAAYKSKGMNEEAEKEMAEYRGLVGR
jgi:Flp pilus assembly protein TadD